ncbi:unnamed protein product [Caenorhabditis bovis]|uniref:Acetyl-CoA carboxylase n=1 Tax=Caenorhabditis bovis TaxID=2654633 RepID=A0A8S1FDZ5_9PELO|nr:unnamed protein product [Caenorhabditis bovis]
MMPKEKRSNVMMKQKLVLRQSSSDHENDNDIVLLPSKDSLSSISIDSPTYITTANYFELFEALGISVNNDPSILSRKFSRNVTMSKSPNLSKLLSRVSDLETSGGPMSVNGRKPDIKKINVSGSDNINEAIQYGSMEEFVEKFVADPTKRRPIRKVLVATNGIGAVRCILAIRRLLNQLFRDDKLIKFICLTTQHEVESNAEYLKLANNLVFSPTGSNRNNYANVDEIIKHAVEKNVDAVWAGWGHASENPELPKRLAEHNIVFVGPPSSAMFSLGDKIASTIIAQTVGIPTIAWSGAGIKMESKIRAKGDFIEVPHELLQKATVSTAQEGLDALKHHNIGFPLMIKASEGGGGKGIRKCTKIEDFKSMFSEVVQELPGSPIFLMKCVENARHIEVQLIADRYENVIPVFTRDCSIQRRCQKIIEEAPANIARPEVLKAMQEDAVRIAKYVGYESAGTVEYMYMPDTEEYFFLELNPRLQVEHPCTEMIANISIPAIQIQIAMGLPLHRIHDVRMFFGLERNGDSPLPEDTVLTHTEHCSIAARITSEDPDDSFRPSTGSVEALNFRSSQDVWGYFSVSSGGKVHEFADSQFGHLFARGRTRADAIGNMLGALKELELRATFKSQVSYLVDLIMEPDFINNSFNTQWLDIRIAKKIKQKCSLPMSDIIAISAAVIGHSRVTQAFDSFKGAIQRGQVLPPNDLTETFLFDLVKDLKIYSVKVTRSAPFSFVILLNGSTTTVNIVLLGNGGLMVTHGDSVYQCNLEETSETFKVTIGNQIIVFEKDNDPSVLKSPYTGKLLAYKKEDGDYVDVGETFATVESMKLVFNVEVKKAPGRLVRVANEGDLLFPGSVIARLVDQKDSEKYRPQPFTGTFKEWTSVKDSKSENNRNLYNSCLEKCRNILAGSVPLGGVAEITELSNELFKYLNADNLAQIILEPVISQASKAFPIDYRKQLGDAIEKANVDGTHILSVLKTASHNEDVVKAINACSEFVNGSRGFAANVLNSLLEDYIKVEKYFEGKAYDDSVAEIKTDYTCGNAVVQTIYSHTQIKSKNIVIKAILEALKVTGSKFIPNLLENLREIGNLHHTTSISSLAREILLIHQNLCYKNNFSAVTDGGTKPTAEEMKEWLNGKNSKQADSQAWKIMHEYFFEKEIGSLALEKFVNNYISAEEGFVENQYVLGTISAIVHINTFNLLKKPTRFHRIVLPGDKLSVVRLQLPSAMYAAGLTHPVFLNFLKEHFAKIAGDVNVSIFVKITDDYSSHTDLSCLTEAEERKVCEAQASVPIITEALKSIGHENVRVNTILCLHDRPLPQLTFFEQVRLEKNRLPLNTYPVSSRLSSVRTYQLDDSDKKFAKLFIRQHLLIPGRNAEEVKKGISEALFAALDNSCTAAQVAMGKTKKIYTSNHIFIHISCPGLSEEDIGSAEHLNFMRQCIQQEVDCHKRILYKHRVTEVEIVYESTEGSKRIVLRDETGVTPEVITEFPEILGKYPALSNIEKKRVATRANHTSYIYDFPMIFGLAAYKEWKSCKKLDIETYNARLQSLPERKRKELLSGHWRRFLDVQELVAKDGKIEVISDEEEMKKRSNNALNKCGMVAWIVRLYTPEKPEGYDSILIGNDITFQSGSFGTAEDELFALASKLARERNLPRVNVSCNSGARIGLAENVSKLVKLQLKNEEKPEQGFEYLYIDAEHKDLVKGQIEYEELANGRLKITAVIGHKDEKIGVENLQGSGLIAGETSRAYLEIPTYCYVTGRSVGIGAYTARLAHRIVQHKQSHLILTGASALNTLLGKDVYTSNNQLGGPEVMFRNGVSHAVVENDLEGIAKVLKWMSYLPAPKENFPFFEKFGTDIAVRDVHIPIEGCEEKQYDVRKLIDSQDIFHKTGICDTMSFDEICGDWAKSIVAGRARLCGIPIGVVASEFRNFQTNVPADPALEGSEAQVLQRAGQVWYPDSAYKTAEAINDLNKENLPLLIIASLRGFSGGQKDMYDMVLKFGAQIVDALAVYDRPVIVYIPEAGELRGGAWAVLDGQIRPEFIHLVADEKSRGGILEPNAIVGIKFREPKQIEMMIRSDKKMRELHEAGKKEEMEERAADLKKVYRSAAVEYADAHDRWQRMKAVGAVEYVTSVRMSRRLFSQIYRNELAKVGLAEKYRNAPHFNRPTLASSMIWVEEQLKNVVKHNSSMDDQYEQIKNYYNTRFWNELKDSILVDRKRYENEFESFLKVCDHRQSS